MFEDILKDLQEVLRKHDCGIWTDDNAPGQMVLHYRGHDGRGVNENVGHCICDHHIQKILNTKA